MSAELVISVQRGTSKQAEYRYDSCDTVIVGRLEDCGITLKEMTVSRYHCLMEIAPPDVSVRELGSRNGTAIIRGGETIPLHTDETARLCDGDTLMLGKDCALGIAVAARDGVRRCEMCNAEFGGSAFDAAAFDAAAFGAAAFGAAAFDAAAFGAAAFGAAAFDADIDICPKCMENEMAVMHYLLKHVEPERPAERTGPDISGYQRLRRLGGGVTGEVWLLLDKENGKQVACKRLREANAVRERVKDRFLRELSIGSQLDHPNIVRQYGCGEDEGGLYTLMEYCPGGSISDYLSNRRVRYGEHIGVAAATNMILQALDGLIYLHGARITTPLATGESRTVCGVVHRDIKPGNLFVMDHGETPNVKLADFGFAKAFETAGFTKYTLTGERGGTWDYTPRAQINDYRYAGPYVDVWAMAATYYFLLTGYTPKQTHGAPNAVAVALNTNATPIRARNRAIPKTLAEAIDYALWEPGEGEKPHVGTAKELKELIEGAI